MKKMSFKYLLYIVCGVIAFGSTFTSCKLDDPGPLPQEELYLRAFIKKYGLIDPNQDWNEAERKHVTVICDYAKAINVFVKYNKMYYRVAYYAEASGVIEIPVDIPEGTKWLFVEVDDSFYQVAVDGTVDLTAPSRSGMSRADDYSANLRSWQLWYDEDLDITHASVDVPMDEDTYVNVSTHLYEENTYNGSDFVSAGGNKTAIDGYPNFLTMAQGDKAYMQFHSTLDVAAPFVLSFETTVSSAATLYVKMEGQLSRTITLTPGSTETHELLISNIGAGAWPQLGFYAAEGDIASIGNIHVERFSTAGDMAWLLVAEDLGATDDFDFNDVIIRIESVAMNDEAVEQLKLQVDVSEWEIIEWDEHLHLEDVHKAPARNLSRADDDVVKLRVTAMCAGGILDSYLHFRTGADDATSGYRDYVLAPSTGDSFYDLTDPNTTITGAEWHSWFEGSWGSIPNERTMVNTGLNPQTGFAVGKSATIVVPGDFTVANYSQIFKDYDGEKDNNLTNPFNHYDPADSQIWTYESIVNCRVQGFYITVRDADPAEAKSIIGATAKGCAPQMFLIPDMGMGTTGYWQWPHERVPINNVYPRFVDWVKNSTNNDWYMDTPVKGTTAINAAGYQDPAYIER